nr:hypothetical protein [Amycolatopsis orientalis]
MDVVDPEHHRSFSRESVQRAQQFSKEIRERCFAMVDLREKLVHDTEREIGFELRTAGSEDQGAVVIGLAGERSQ